MDVANYYPSLSQATLTSSMNSLGVSSFGVEVVNGFLNACDVIHAMLRTREHYLTSNQLAERANTKKAA